MSPTELAIGAQIQMALLRAVDDMRPFVTHRLQRRLGDVDAVLQEIRETAWRKAAAFDPNIGRPEDFVFGISKNIVRRLLTRQIEPTQVLDDSLPGRSPDPLAVLTTRFEAQRWVRLVTEHVSPDDWALVVELALRGSDSEAVASQFRVSARAVRTAREHVSLVACTVRAALVAVDAGRPACLEVAVECLPNVGAVQSVLPWIGESVESAVDELGVHPGTARARLATVRRLLSVAMSVLVGEAG